MRSELLRAVSRGGDVSRGSSGNEKLRALNTKHGAGEAANVAEFFAAAGLPADAPMRDVIRAELSAIVPLDALERQHLADALAWIDSGADLFRVATPATPPKHLVSYCAVVDADRILLVDHRNARLWLPPGGHVETDEHPRATVARELQEELGLCVNHDLEAPLMVTCTTTVGRTAGHTDVSLWYVVHVNCTQALTFDHTEFDAVRWFPFAAVPFERSDPHLRRFIHKLSRRPAQGVAPTGVAI